MLTNTRTRRLEMPEESGRARSGVSERTVRRLVTIITALGVIIVSFVVAVVFSELSGHHHRVRMQQIDSLLQIAASGLDASTSSMDTVRAPVADDLGRVLPGWAFDEQRFFIIANADGIVHVIAGTPPAALKVQQGEELPAVLRQAFQTQSRQNGAAASVYLPPRGPQLLVAVRALSGWPGVVMLIQPANAQTAWNTGTTALLGSIVGLLLILVTLLVLYNWQADQTAAENSGHVDFINRLETALELGRCGLWDWDVARGRIYLTRSMRRLLGLPEDVDSYMDLADFLQLQHPEERPLDELLEEQLATGEQTFEQELRLRNLNDGTWLWLKLRGALPSETDGAQHLVGIAIDITAQKRAAADKRDAELLLDQAIESISESFALWDAGMRLVKCNSKFREFHGLPASACRPGRAYADIMSEAGCRCRHREFRHVLQGMQGRETVMEIELEDGRWLQISERQMERGGCVSVGTDITELKRKQLELENSRRELEETVKALELSQQEIRFKNEHLQQLARNYRKEKERAERALEMKSQILANVSHELFTPLNHIVMPAEIMLHQTLGPLDERYVEYARQILQAGSEMQRKIADIMEYAELSAERRKLSRGIFRPAELLAEVAEEHVAKAEEKGIVLDWRAPEELLACADVRRLKGALRQLVSNAVTFTEKGEVIITAEMKEDGTLLMQVRDTGVGIPEELLSRIGQPFERAGDAYNSHNGGSGIGLAIARAVVEMHDGQMVVESAVGRGTLVQLIIPHAAADEARDEETLREPAE